MTNIHQHTSFTPEQRLLVEAELDRLAQSPGFVNSKILTKFLKFIVTKSLAGQSNEIKEYTIGTEVLARPTYYNRMADASVRIHAVRLRKALYDHYSTLDNTGVVRIDVPKGTYVPDISFSGQQYPSDQASETIGFEEWRDKICVMPFGIMPGIEHTGFSVDGFCSYLDGQLSLFQDIVVISYFSVQRFLDNGGNVNELKEKLGIDYYISGSIEFENSIAKFTVQLYDAASNAVIWSHQLTSSTELSELPQLAIRVSTQVASSLLGYSGILISRKLLTEASNSRFSSIQVEAIFLYYRYHSSSTEKNFVEAVERMEHAIEKQIPCALCYAILANLYLDGILYKYKTVDDPIGRAMELLQKALHLEPECQHAHLMSGWINCFLKQPAKAYEAFKKVEDINPHSSFFMASFSFGMSFIGEYETALNVGKKSMMVNPYPSWWTNIPDIFASLRYGDHEKALFHSRKVRNHAMIFDYVLEMVALYYLERYEEIKILLDIYRKNYPDGLKYISETLPEAICDSFLAEKLRIAIEAIDKIDTRRSVKI